MTTSKSKLYRVFAVIGIGLAVCGLKLWMDFYASPSVVYSHQSTTEASSGTASESSFIPAVTSVASQTDELVSAAYVPTEIPIYLCGAVVNPGIYEIDPGTYLYEVIETAGGLLPEAAAEHINLVFCLSEAVSVYIPSCEEMQSFINGKDNASSEYLRNGLLQGIWGTGSGQSNSVEGTSQTQTPALININSAEQIQLETLPGVGETTAKAIIAYREKSGGFAKIEDIMNVPGIKEGRFEALREFITV